MTSFDIFLTKLIRKIIKQILILLKWIHLSNRLNIRTGLKNISIAINKISFTKDRAAKYSFRIPYMLNCYSLMTLPSRTDQYFAWALNVNLAKCIVKAILFETKAEEFAKSMNIKFHKR